MKTKLTMIGLVLAIGGWMAIGDSPRARSLEQRVTDLEQLVVMQSQRLDAQQAQLDRVLPLADEIEITTTSSGWRWVDIPRASLWIGQGIVQADNVVATHNLYYIDDLIDLEP